MRSTRPVNCGTGPLVLSPPKNPDEDPKSPPQGPQGRSRGSLIGRFVGRASKSARSGILLEAVGRVRLGGSRSGRSVRRRQALQFREQSTRGDLRADLRAEIVGCGSVRGFAQHLTDGFCDGGGTRAR